MENTQDFSSILNHIASHIDLNQQEQALFVSVLKVRNVKRKQFLEQPGFVSSHRTYVVDGAFRAYLVGTDGQEHTLSLAVNDWMIGDPGSFLSQEPATLFVEAIEDSTVIQWSYESEQMLVENIPRFAVSMMRRAQQIAVMMQRRVVSLLSLTAEERYAEFAQNYPLFVQRIPLYIIASYLGMTREFLSKIRNQRTTQKP